LLIRTHPDSGAAAKIPTVCCVSFSPRVLISQTAFNDIARLMNERPRKTLDWQTPNEAMAQEMAKFQKKLYLILEAAHRPHLQRIRAAADSLAARRDAQRLE